MLRGEHTFARLLGYVLLVASQGCDACAGQHVEGGATEAESADGWVYGVGSPDVGDSAVALDRSPDGELCLLVRTRGDLELDGAEVLGAPGEGFDTVLVRLDGNGRVRYARRFASIRLEDVACHDGGRTAVAGSHGEEGGVLVSMYGGEGEPLWSTRHGGARDEAVAIASDGAGGLFVAGNFSGTLALGDIELESGGTRFLNFFVARLSPDGSPLWARGQASSGLMLAHALAVAPDGDVLLGGTGRYGFVLRYSPAGERRWDHELSGEAVGDVHDVAVAADGRVALVGSFTGTIDLGTGDGDVTSSSDPMDAAYVVVLGADGRPAWSFTFEDGDADPLQTSRVAFTPGGGLVVAGDFMDELVAGEQRARARDIQDSFVLRLDRDGGATDLATFGGGGNDGFRGLAATSEEGSLFVAGNCGEVFEHGSLHHACSGPYGDALVARIRFPAE